MTGLKPRRRFHPANWQSRLRSRSTPLPSAGAPKISVVLTLAAWLFATGSQWNLVQVFAWSRMFVLNTHTLPLFAAAQRTFSPEGRCSICQAVVAAQQPQEKNAVPPGGTPGAKTFLFFQRAPSPVVAAPMISPWSPGDRLIPSVERAAPPLPPPRALA